MMSKPMGGMDHDDTDHSTPEHGGQGMSHGAH